ncbi:MAG TPA: alpha/beta hydrolase [Candidatus Saccharibacteria bacterium]|nr:alpha/beta hydrolase [Candidatus Saccharibacteria bacterium]
MMQTKYLNTKEYNGSSGTTIYFMGPYGGRALYFKPFFMAMTRRHYRIVYIQPRTSSVDSLNPKNLSATIYELTEYVSDDMSHRKGDDFVIVGVSLGSYLGLNLLGVVPIYKYVAIAGGAPILEVFKDARLFAKSRKKLREVEGAEESLYLHWQPHDTNFKKRNLTGVKAVVFNSDGDRIITPSKRDLFLEQLSAAGVVVNTDSRGSISHTLQALKTNLLVDNIDAFIRSE